MRVVEVPFKRLNALGLSDFARLQPHFVQVVFNLDRGHFPHSRIAHQPYFALFVLFFVFVSFRYVFLNQEVAPLLYVFKPDLHFFLQQFLDKSLPRRLFSHLSKQDVLNAVHLLVGLVVRLNYTLHLFSVVADLILQCYIIRDGLDYHRLMLLFHFFPQLCSLDPLSKIDHHSVESSWNIVPYLNILSSLLDPIV